MIQGTEAKEGARNDLQVPRGSLVDHEKKEINRCSWQGPVCGRPTLGKG